CVDNVRHIAVRELRRERQTHGLLPDAKAVRIIFRPPAEPLLIIRMDRNTLIMHTNPDVLGSHISDKLVTRQPSPLRIYQYGIEMIGVARPLIRLRRKSQGEAGEFPLIGLPYFFSTLPVHIDAAKLIDPDRCLDVHHVVFIATIDDVVVLETLITEAAPRVFAHSVQGKDLIRSACFWSVVKTIP